RADRMGHAERVLLETVARAVLHGNGGDLRTHLDRPDAVRPSRTRLEPTSLPRVAHTAPDVPVPSVALGNGFGGFTDGGRTYAIVLDGADETPMPWTNVIANARFGTIVTASGSAHTWSENSRENRLTSFANDPAVDPTAEALFVRDDDSGDAWSPTPGPMKRHRKSGQFLIHHSAGVTRFSRS